MSTLSPLETITLSIASLRSDLKCAWDFRNMVTIDNADGSLSEVETKDAMYRLRMASDYIYGIDPESMATLKAIMKTTPYNYSLVSLAKDVMAGRSAEYLLFDNDPFSKRERKSNRR